MLIALCENEPPFIQTNILSFWDYSCDFCFGALGFCQKINIIAIVHAASRQGILVGHPLEKYYDFLLTVTGNEEIWVIDVSGFLWRSLKENH